MFLSTGVIQTFLVIEEDLGVIDEVIGLNEEVPESQRSLREVCSSRWVSSI